MDLHNRTALRESGGEVLASRGLGKRLMPRGGGSPRKLSKQEEGKAYFAQGTGPTCFRERKTRGPDA